jgi:hypothetical protein
MISISYVKSFNINKPTFMPYKIIYSNAVKSWQINYQYKKYVGPNTSYSFNGPYSVNLYNFFKKHHTSFNQEQEFYCARYFF